MPAGSSPPAPADIDGVHGRIHAIDGDGTAVCTGGDIEQIDHHTWDDVPEGRRCPLCGAIASQPTRRTS